MQEHLKDILSHLSTEVDQETLLLYLQGKLSPDKQHEVEKQMMETDFAADAFEGLGQIKDKQQLAHLVDQLNKDLKKKTEKKNAFRAKLKIKQEPWALIALALVLLFVVLGYVVIRHYMR